MTTVYSTQNSSRFYLHKALLKSFSHRFSEIKLLKHFYPWASHTLLPNLYGHYRGKNTVLGPAGAQWIFQIPLLWHIRTLEKGSWLFQYGCTSMGPPKDPLLRPHLSRLRFVTSTKGDQAQEADTHCCVSEETDKQEWEFIHLKHEE